MITDAVATVLAEWTEEICSRVKAKWGNMVGIQGEAEIEASLPKVVGDTLVATIEASGGKAWIAEFGSGSEAAGVSENPYLKEYANSPNFNHYRSASDMTIRGRDKGPYTDLDGNPEYSSGRAAGRDLELKPVYPGMTMVPFYVIRQEIEDAYPEIIPSIQQAIQKDVASQLAMSIEMYI
jgi:hypothetical protein